jgi:hypothetical protein
MIDCNPLNNALAVYTVPELNSLFAFCNYAQNELKRFKKPIVLHSSQSTITLSLSRFGAVQVQVEK